MTLQSHATPEVLAKPEFVSPLPDDFDPFAHWAATLDGAVNKCNLSIGEVQLRLGLRRSKWALDSHPVVLLASNATSPRRACGEAAAILRHRLSEACYTFSDGEGR